MIFTDVETWYWHRQGTTEVCMYVCMLVHTGMKYPTEIKWKEKK